MRGIEGMARKQDEGQTRLRVITNIDDSPHKPHVDPATGDPRLFTITTELTAMPSVPPEMEPFANFMNNKLKQSQAENKGLKAELIRTRQQFGRVGNSVEKLIYKLEQKTISNQNPDIVVGSHTHEADVILAESALPAELVYEYTTSDLAQLIGLSASRLGTLFKKAGISGNDRLHYSMRTGLKGMCQRYKMLALDELYELAKEGRFEGMKSVELAKLENYLRMKDAQV
jgi:hypothetical protein